MYITVSTVREIALGEVGYHEAPVNRTKYGQWFGWNGVAWCNIFLCWVFGQAGDANRIPRTASVWQTWQEFSKRGRTYTTPRIGDLAVFRNWSHIELVVGLRDGMVETVGGNTSAGDGSFNNGGEVARRLRDRSLIMGYCRPKYDWVQSLYNPLPLDGNMDLTAPYSADVRALQIYLNHDIHAGLVVDGQYGPKTVAALQRWLRQYVDSTWSAMNTRALQAKIGAVVDGVWGPATSTRLQDYLNDHRTYVQTY